VGAEDSDFVAMLAVQDAQAVGVGDPRRAVELDQTLEQAQPDRAPLGGAQLGVIEVGVAGVQEPSITVGDGDPRVTARVSK
jgi:hypothetical protein